MTGPPYPHPSPIPRGIGEFIIGVSPIGIPATFDVWATVLSQYANSPVLTGMIEAFNDAADQTANLENFYDLIWNVATAQGYGLDVWGRIVGVGRVVAVVSASEYIGFQEAGSPGGWTGFDQGIWYSGSGISDNVLLSDTQFRTLILAKAAGNISDGSIVSMNAILMALFPNRGDVYVRDNLDMSLDYVFSFPVSPVELTILRMSGVLPNPCGVVINVESP